MRGIVEFREGLEIFGGGSGRWSGVENFPIHSKELISYPKSPSLIPFNSQLLSHQCLHGKHFL